MPDEDNEVVRRTALGHRASSNRLLHYGSGCGTGFHQRLAIRLVRQPRAELGTEHGTVYRVANQLGYGFESVRAWVRQADIDEGKKPGTTSQEAEKIKALEQENRELKRANEILKRASAFFA